MYILAKWMPSVKVDSQWLLNLMMDKKVMLKYEDPFFVLYSIELEKVG